MCGGGIYLSDPAPQRGRRRERRPYQYADAPAEIWCVVFSAHLLEPDIFGHCHGVGRRVSRQCSVGPDEMAGSGVVLCGRSISVCRDFQREASDVISNIPTPACEQRAGVFHILRRDRGKFSESLDFMVSPFILLHYNRGRTRKHGPARGETVGYDAEEAVFLSYLCPGHGHGHHPGGDRGL